MARREHPLNRFTIGDWVVVKATVEAVKDWSKMKHATSPPHKRMERTELSTLMRGQIVGASNIQEGEIAADYEYGN